jgi:hypothetical protein
MSSSVRHNNTIELYEYPAFSDAAGNTGADRRATMSARFSSGGETLASVANGSPFTPMSVDVDQLPATYEFEQTVNRRVPWSRLGSTVQSVWAFRSARTSWYRDLPLVDISFTTTGLDNWNAAGAAPVTITASASTRGIPGAVTTLTRLEYSTDDGASWTELPLSGSGGSTAGPVTVPAPAAFVALRATALGSLERTVIRAFGGPAQTGDESAGATRISKVMVNGGKPFVFSTPNTYYGNGEIPVTFTVTDPAGVASADIAAYHGAYARRDAMFTTPADCRPADAGVSSCTATVYLDTMVGPGRNVLAGPWKVNVVASSADGTGFADAHAAGSFSMLRQTRLTVNATPEPVKKGKKLTITGQLTQSNWETLTFSTWSGQPVQLQFCKAGTTAYRVVKTVRSGTRGALKTTVTATVDGAYRYAFPGSSAFAAGTSSGDAIDVR